MSGAPNARRPTRIRRERRSGWRLPEGAKCVTRGTRWGNPFPYLTVQKGMLEAADFSTIAGFDMADYRGMGGSAFVDVVNRAVLDLFRTYATIRAAGDPDWLKPLRGMDLACFCKPTDPCHADILLELANPEPVKRFCEACRQGSYPPEGGRCSGCGRLYSPAGEIVTSLPERS